MQAGFLNNLVPLTKLTSNGVNGSQGSVLQAAGEEGAFQLLLESMLFEVVAGQVLQEGKGLLARMDLGLLEEDDDQQPKGQGLLALLESLQAPLLDHFRQAQINVNVAGNEPDIPGQTTATSVWPIKQEAQPYTMASLASEEQGSQGQVEGEIRSELPLALAPKVQENDGQKLDPKLLNQGVNKLGTEQLIPIDSVPDGADLDAGSSEERPLATVTTSGEDSVLNLMAQEQHRLPETASQVASIRQPAQGGNSLSFNDLAEQIVQSGKLKMLGDKHEIELQLKPEYLGKLAIRLSLENGVMTARFLIENHHVARLVDSNLSQLKQSLEDQGVRFEQVQVEVGDPGSFTQERQQDWQQRGRYTAPIALTGEQNKEVATEYQETSRQGGIDYRA